MKVQGLAVAALTFLFAVAARAEEPTFQFLPEPDLQAIVVKTVEPLKAKDAFAGLPQCSVVDAKTFAPVNTAQALKMLKPCFQAVSERYGQPVRLEPLAFAQSETLAPQMEGLAVYVPEQLGVLSPLMRDLEHALETRRGRILGQPVVIRRGSVASDNKPLTSPDALTISALQRTIDGCYTTQVVRSIATSEDFIASYGRCIVSDPDLRVRAIRPTRGQLGVQLQSDADLNVVRTLNGQVRVFGGEGPVTVSVVAYSSISAL